MLGFVGIVVHRTKVEFGNTANGNGWRPRFALQSESRPVCCLKLIDISNTTNESQELRRFLWNLTFELNKFGVLLSAGKSV